MEEQRLKRPKPATGKFKCHLNKQLSGVYWAVLISGADDVGVLYSLDFLYYSKCLSIFLELHIQIHIVGEVCSKSIAK